MRIYLDIDGTLIHEDVRNYGKPAMGLEELLTVLKYHDTYWLTAHCRDGDPTTAQAMLKSVTSPEYHETINNIKPTVWDVQKVEGIDWLQEFIWLDNNINQFEQVHFHKTMMGQNVIEMNLVQNPEQLREIAEDLSKLSNTQG
ncbi:MAG TPA: hypothetical protein PKA42_03680 [Candidatus Paceibacterota bacterium]|nr:hypothetical protein [Candidatus Paceibacterota bacterium]HMO83240.1 hypothetical protein [Candidatus Paceibacterota bacterium]